MGKSPRRSRRVALSFFAAAAAVFAAEAAEDAGVPVMKFGLYAVLFNVFTARTVPVRLLTGLAKWTCLATPCENICPSNDLCRDGMPPIAWNAGHEKARMHRRKHRGHASSRSTSDVASECE